MAHWAQVNNEFAHFASSDIIELIFTYHGSKNRTYQANPTQLAQIPVQVLSGKNTSFGFSAIFVMMMLEVSEVFFALIL